MTNRHQVTLDRWLNEPAVGAHVYRDDFFLKVMDVARSGDAAGGTGEH